MENTNLTGPARFEDGPALRLTGLSQRYYFAETGQIPALWGRFGPSIRHNGRPLYGVIEGDGEDSLVYSAMMELDADEEAPEGLTLKEFPAQRYAVFPHAGHVSRLCETIDLAFNRWLPTSGCTPALNPDSFEHYGPRFDPKTGSGDLEVWVPIR